MRRLLATVLLGAAAAQTMAAQDWDPDRRWRSRDGLQIRVGRDYHLPQDQIASWPIVIVGGSATIDGRVDEDLIVVGGRVRVGPTAQLYADIVAVGGDVQVAEAADVRGEIHNVSIWGPDMRFALRDLFWSVDHEWWAGVTLATTVFRFTLFMVVSCLLALLTPRWIRGIEARAADAPFVSGMFGAFSEMMFLPVLLVVIAGLVITIIGIPFLLVVPFAVLAFVVTWVAGFTAVAAQVGRRLRARVRLADDSRAIDVAWGVMAIFLFTFVGNVLAFAAPWLVELSSTLSVVGFAVEYVAWTVGLGAALLAPFQRRWQITPPPVPSPLSANA